MPLGRDMFMASPQRFADVKKKLEQAGWKLDRIRGSHHVFVKRGRPNVVIPVHKGKVLPVYVRQVEKALQQE
jgi:predicted RNA binding protein YcfA (HicA-like mRNA interferase family)